MLGPPGGVPISMVGGSEPWDTDGLLLDNNNDNDGTNSILDNPNTNLVVWRERERRQRTIRVLMMFLLMLLLMDGEEQQGNTSHNRNSGPGGLRKRKKDASSSQLHDNEPLEVDVFQARSHQDALLRTVAVQHPRYQALLQKNGGKNYEMEVVKWAEQQSEQEKDEFFLVSSSLGNGDSDSSSSSSLGSTTPLEEQQQEQQQQQSSSLHHQLHPSVGGGTGAGELLTHHHHRDPEEDRKVFHYPWNTTGFYRGEWTRKTLDDDDKKKEQPVAAGSTTSDTTAELANSNTNTTITFQRQRLDAVALEHEMLHLLQHRRRHNKEEENDNVGVLVLPPGKEIWTRDDNNLTSMGWEQMRVDAAGRTYRPKRRTFTDTSSSSSVSNAKKPPSVPLTHDGGRAAFQIFSRAVPSMKEISLVDGFVKLYDSSSPGYSTRKDVLLRVRGVLIHAIGRISLVSTNYNDDNIENVIGRSALVIAGEPTKPQPISGSVSGTTSDGTSTTATTTTAAAAAANNNVKQLDAETTTMEKEKDLQVRRRRLLEALENVEQADANLIREDAVALFAQHHEIISSDTTTIESSFQSPGWDEEELEKEGFLHDHDASDKQEHEEEMLASKATITEEAGQSLMAMKSKNKSESSVLVERRMTESPDKINVESSNNNSKLLPPWSNIVIPYPFVRDDKDESIRKVRTPAARRMPPREQLLELNAAGCEFEITMDVQEVEWTVGAWRNLLTRRFKEARLLDPSLREENNAAASSSDAETDTNEKHAPSVSSLRSPSLAKQARNREKLLQDQALVVTMIGSIHSNNCNFHASLNATALRTDWEATTGKAINYSFYMMLVCLTQILVLLRQLLHSQSQSAASRVSLLCIGWQTVIDALLCLVHIYLSLAMQPLFTAFASVAFFKLLIFCVIEMKYMAMVIQARNSSHGGETTEVLRRQIAILHLRFYVALFGTFLAVFYVGEKYRSIYALALYSFWVPQIVLNVYTEARTPLHKYYIYGMSLSRLVAPLYMFSLSNNFLKEVYPDSPTDQTMCQLIVLWVGIQTAVLIAQGKYGARFMIPARFLPPKFDYSRPLPPSMLPAGVQDVGRGATIANLTDPPANNRDLSPAPRDRHTTAVTTRNRIRGNRANRAETNAMTQESIIHLEEQSPSPAVPPHQALDCSICYDCIDVRNRSGYMLAPCDHIFHRDCLIQWMDVKMECPICRTELPAL